MEEFPETFNRRVCNDTMAQNQEVLIKEVRKIFYDLVNSAVKECNPVVGLEFPERLWHEHRKTLIKELLDRFGKVKIQVSNVHHETTRLITTIEDVPTSVKKVIIEFIRD